MESERKERLSLKILNGERKRSCNITPQKIEKILYRMHFLWPIQGKQQTNKKE